MMELKETSKNIMTIAMAATRPTVLIVEDEPLIREVMTKWLERAGWKCCAAATTAEALALQASHQPGIALCDVSLEGLENGVDLAVELVGRNTRLAVVFATGDPSFQAPEIKPVGCLLKPFTHQQLKEQLSAAMEHLARSN